MYKHSIYETKNKNYTMYFIAVVWNQLITGSKEILDRKLENSYCMVIIK